MFKILETDTFCSGDPNDTEVNLPPLPEQAAREIAAILNHTLYKSNRARSYIVIKDEPAMIDYEI